MDPNATLRAIDEARNLITRVELTLALREWLRKGGFAPTWSAYPEASAYVLRFLNHGTPNPDWKHVDAIREVVER